MFNTLPTRFRHYEVLKLLGRGGFGVVYLARDMNLKRLVVLKMLHSHLAAQPEMVQRFLREAQAMARLDHANIVRVNRVENDPQEPFFEMEYVEGQTLAAYRRGRVLPLPEAMPILKQMAAALDAAHQCKMVHRDVKPANVLIKPDGTLKLTDFGIIKLLEATGTVHPSTGGMIGTPVYMAPEQADLSRKHEIGPATDIYALGVMTYQLLTGHLPFEGHPHSVLAAHATQPPPDPRQFNRYLSPPIAQILLQALHKQPLNRYPSAMSFVDALEEAASGGARVPAASPTAPPTASTTISPTAPPITDPFRAASGGAAPNIGQANDNDHAQNKMAWPMLIGLLVAIVMVAGLVLRTLIFPEPVETAVVFATEAPAEPTAVAIEPSEVPPTIATSPLGILSIGSTMIGQDGMTLLYVPEGEFLRGSKEDDPKAYAQEQPQRSIYLDAFWIDQTEVSNEMFATFLNQEGNQIESDVRWLDIKDKDALIEESTVGFQPKQTFAKHPVIEVTWYGAKAYCEWAGRRLPTEAEWEKAARGTDGRIYPWGNEDVADNLANLCDKNCDLNWKDESIDDGYARTAPVGSYPDGASSYGALDMAGNVWEWATDWYDADYYKNASLHLNPQGPATGTSKALRGGSWNLSGGRRLRVGDRSEADPVVSDNDWGFRCAASP